MLNRLLVVPTLLLVGFAAHAADKEGCRDPAWAPHRLPGFELRSCETRAWRSDRISIPGGEKNLEGKETTLTYVLTDESKNPTAAKARAFYTQQATAAGATLTNPRDGWSAYLSKKSGAGESWFLYDHGGGNEGSTTSYTLRTIEPAPFSQEVVARAMPGALVLGSGACANPAWLVKGPAGFSVTHCDRKEWTSESFDLPSGEKKVEGRMLSVRYERKGAEAGVYPLWLQRNFVNALTRAGAKLVSRPERASTAVLTQKTSAGEFWFVYEQSDGNGDETRGFRLTTYEVGSLSQRVIARRMTSPLDPASTRCDGAPWIATAYPDFKVRDCEGRAWDRVSVATTSGEQVVEGKRLSVRYAFDGKHDAPTGLDVARNHAQALTRIGATQRSKPDESAHAALSEKLPFGDVWYLYDQSGGSDSGVDGFTLTTLQPGPLPQEVIAQPVRGALEAKGCADPPWVRKQLPYFKRTRCDNRDFDSVELHLAKETKKVAGVVLESHYDLSDAHRTPTALAVQLNFVRALEKVGARLVSRPDDAGLAVLTQETPAGTLWSVYEQSGGSSDAVTSFRLLTIGPGAPTACKMEIYGLNFDFDKATLRPDSEPVLQALLAMFQRAPDAAGELGGHTDNVGKAAYNQKLSGERADAVKTWLVAHGIAAGRLTTRGYGDTRPLVPNDSDANRAKNRRVELKRSNCRER